MRALKEFRFVVFRVVLGHTDATSVHRLSIEIEWMEVRKFQFDKCRHR